MNWLEPQSPSTLRESLIALSEVLLKRPYSGAGSGQQFVLLKINTTRNCVFIVMLVIL